MKKILYIIKRLVFAILLIYAYDKLAFSLDIIIPFNIITILLVSIFDIPGIILLVLLSLL